MIEDYLNQTTSWKTNKHIPDLYGQNTYNAPVTIKCRIKNVVVKNSIGHQSVVTRNSIVYTVSSVQAGDLLGDVEVLHTEPLVNYAGVVVGVVCYT